MSAAAKKIAAKLRWRAGLLRKIADELDALAAEIDPPSKSSDTQTTTA